jgi:DNA topoisomerase-3
VWLATDCDREGQLIGQEILEHYDYRGVVMRVIFTAQDPQTIRDAFARARPNGEYARLYAAAVARRQADQIYNLSLTRTATVTLARGTRSVIGVGRVKTPTLAIVCKRELEIRNFVPQAYFEVVVMAQVEDGQFRMRHAPKERIVKRDVRPRRSQPPPRHLRDRSWCESKTGDKDRRGCMICHRYRSCAARASAGRRREHWR